MSFSVLSCASLFWNLTEMGYVENMDLERRTVQNRSSRNRRDKLELGSCGFTLVL